MGKGGLCFGIFAGRLRETLRQFFGGNRLLRSEPSRFPQPAYGQNGLLFQRGISHAFHCSAAQPL